MHYLAIDTETTGVDLNNDSLIEAAFVYDNGKSLVELPRLEILILKNRWECSTWALQNHTELWKLQNDITPDYRYLINDHFFTGTQVKFAIKPDQGFLGDFRMIFDRWLHNLGIAERITVAGKNPSFDLAFLTPFGINHKFHRRVIDPTLLYLSENDTILPDLQTCLGRAGLNTKVKHRALDDAFNIIQLLRAKDVHLTV